MGSILPTLGVWLAGFLGQWAPTAAFTVGHKAGRGAPSQGSPREARVAPQVNRSKTEVVLLVIRSSLYLYQHHHQDLHV